MSSLREVIWSVLRHRGVRRWCALILIFAGVFLAARSLPPWLWTVAAGILMVWAGLYLYGADDSHGRRR